MPGRDVIVIGASAGGVEALRELIRHLPADLPAAVFIVVHIPADAPSLLPRILSRAGSLKASHATDGEAIEHGRIYIAPPDRHLLVRRGHMSLVQGPKENGHRPAIDPLFRSAARAFGRRTIGVVLSGNLNDGSYGLGMIKACGGTAVVQDPDDALYPGMPSAAIETAAVDHVFPIAAIGDLLARLAAETVAEEEIMPGADEVESERPAKQSEEGERTNASLGGEPSVYTCPECHGNLWEIRGETLSRYRCRVGHSYTEDTLIYEKSESLEAALWMALEALEERGELLEKVADRLAASGRDASARLYRERARGAAERAELVRGVLIVHEDPLEPAREGAA